MNAGQRPARGVHFFWHQKKKNQRRLLPPNPFKGALVDYGGKPPSSKFWYGSQSLCPIGRAMITETTRGGSPLGLAPLRQSTPDLWWSERTLMKERRVGAVASLPWGRALGGWCFLLVLFFCAERKGQNIKTNHFTIFQSKNLYLSDKNSKFADGNVKSLING